jgi:CheY-like chemotaxis protein
VPGSRFRRIPREALIAFMKDNNIPPDALDNGKLKILVVDDDPEIVELFVDVLERDGRFEVKTGEHGLRRGHAHAGVPSRPDHPGLHAPGRERQRGLPAHPLEPGVRAHEDHHRLGVVNQDEINDLLKAGADDFVKKPFNIEKLIERIGELC